MFEIFLISFFLISKITCCGITTHIEIAHRASYSYDYLIDNQTSVQQLIKKYQSAFQAGNPYPDSYYPSICKKGALGDVSEDTHWTPFLNATIRYIQKNYKKPYNQNIDKDALRLIVFTLGYVSHQIADVTWHSLGVLEGFLSAMGYVNFHGSFSNAHSVGDFGGDVVNQFELNTDYISDLGEWYVPYEDLYNIYLDLYGSEKITRTDIIECSSLLFLGRLGEQIAVSLLYADYFKKSIFLADRLNDYFLGGIDDMAAWTQITWNKVFYMLENGIEKCQLDHNVLYVNCDMNQTFKDLKFKKISKSIPIHFHHELNLNENYIIKNITIKGLIISTNKQMLKNYSKVSSKLTKMKSSITIFSQNDYSNLGYSLESCDLDNNGFLDDLLIGAPVHSDKNLYQNGIVYLFKSFNKSVKFQNVDLYSSLILKPPQDSLSSRFGHSVLSLDLNLDGFNDIIVSAPSYNLHNIKYEGRVYIYFGNKLNNFDSEPSLTITCRNIQYCNLGWGLSKGDVNNDGLNDLIISSPYASTCESQCGFVSVLFSNFNISQKKEIDFENLDFILYGNMAYEWFGFSAKSKLGYLIVGAPQSRLCSNPDCEVSQNDTQSVGRVYFYKYPSNKPLLVLTGQTEFEQFGCDFDLSEQYSSIILAVSSPSKNTKIESKNSIELNRAGVVQLFKIEYNLDYSLISTFKSDRPYSSFGSKVKFYKLNEDYEDLFISSEMRSENIALIDQIQEGLVYVFNGGKYLYSNVTDQCPVNYLTPCPGKHAKLVLNGLKRSRFGSDFALLYLNKNSTNLAVSSIHADYNKSRLSGQVNIFDL